LLPAGNFAKTKFDHQGVFMRLFLKAVSDLIQDFNSRANDLEHFFFE
jgi:hypothetical protein